MAVVELLRIVIRHAGTPLVADPTGARPECAAALRAVQRIGAVEALPKVDEFLSFQIVRSQVFFVDWLSGLFELRPFDQAHQIAEELRQKVRKDGQAVPRSS
jgi:hypothetical protein